MFYSPEDLETKIENEGFDYFFRFYVSPKEIPPQIKEEYRIYCASADDLIGAMREYGVDTSNM